MVLKFLEWLINYISCLDIFSILLLILLTVILTLVSYTKFPQCFSFSGSIAKCLSTLAFVVVVFLLLIMLLFISKILIFYFGFEAVVTVFWVTDRLLIKLIMLFKTLLIIFLGYATPVIWDKGNTLYSRREYILLELHSKMQKLLCKLLIIRGGPTIYYLVICLWPQLLCLMYYFLLLALWVAGVIVEFTMHVTLCNIYSIVNSIPNYFTFFDSWCGSLLTSNILMTAATSLNGGEGAVNVSGLEGNPVLYKKLTLPALDPTWYNRTGGKMDYDPLRFNDKGLPIEAGTWVELLSNRQVLRTPLGEVYAVHCPKRGATAFLYLPRHTTSWVWYMTKCQVNPFPGGFIKPLQLEGASPAELSQSVSYLELLEKFDKTRGSFAPRDVFDASYMPKYIRKRVSWIYGETPGLLSDTKDWAVVRPRLSWIRSKPYSELLSELNDLINMERAYYEKSLSKVSYYETKGKIFENKAKSGHLQMDKIVTYLNKELFWEERRNRSEARLLTYIEFRDTLRELVKKTGT